MNIRYLYKIIYNVMLVIYNNKLLYLCYTHCIPGNVILPNPNTLDGQPYQILYIKLLSQGRLVTAPSCYCHEGPSRHCPQLLLPPAKAGSSAGAAAVLIGLSWPCACPPPPPSCPPSCVPRRRPCSQHCPRPPRPPRRTYPRLPAPPHHFFHTHPANLCPFSLSACA